MPSQAYVSEPGGAVEIETETRPEATQDEEVKPKPRRVLTEKQLESLKRAREAAAWKKREL